MSSKTTTTQAVPDPTIVVGYEYHKYTNTDRYVYIGKDEDSREPQFLDYGKVAERNARSAQAHVETVFELIQQT